MEVDWNALVGEAVTQLLKIFVPVLVVLVLKWLVEIWKKVREQNPQLAEMIAYAARLGYAAAEDYFRNTRNATGEEKMDYAIYRAQKYLEGVGQYIDDEVLKDSITEYGVENYRFSWAKPMFDLSALMREGEKNESGLTGDMRVGDRADCGDADRDADREQPVGQDQGPAKDEG